MIKNHVLESPAVYKTQDRDSLFQAQFMASEYKKRGGSYNTDKKDQDDSQKNLSKWGEEEWQTKEGSGNAKQDDGTEKRYLPKKAWEQMSEKEKKETDEKKLEESKEGKQFVQNTNKAKESRQKANEEESEEYEDEKQGEKTKADEDGVEEDEEENPEDEYQESDEEGDEEEEEDETQDQGDKEEEPRGEKRSKSNQQSSRKSQKSNSGKGKQSNGTVGSKKQSADAPATQASVDRLPDQGKKVFWKALPGWVDGEVVEIVYEHKDVQGKSVKASEKDPRIVLKSASSGKIAVHKPEAVYFD